MWSSLAISVNLDLSGLLPSTRRLRTVFYNLIEGKVLIAEDGLLIVASQRWLGYSLQPLDDGDVELGQFYTFL